MYPELPSKRPLQMVIGTNQLTTYQQVATAMNIPLKVITQPGEECHLLNGGSYILSENQIEVEISSPNSDLSDFWEAVGL